jgi:hypothetical protein
MSTREFGATRKVVTGQRRTSNTQKGSSFFNDRNTTNRRPSSGSEKYVLEERPMQNGELVEGTNKVQFIGYIGYQQINETPNGHLKLSALFFIPFDKDGERKRIGYKIQAWDELAEVLNDIEPGTPLQIHGSLVKYSPKDGPEQYSIRVDEYWDL